MDKTWELFIQDTPDEKPVFLQLDNYSVQATNFFKRRAKKDEVLLVYTQGSCTDLQAVIGDEMGRFLKTKVAEFYRQDFESSQERTDAYTDGKVSASERRILVSRWLGEAWKIWKSFPGMITTSFKRMGAFNDIHGRENHLVKVRNMYSYEVPPRGSPRLEAPTKEEVLEIIIKEREAKRSALARQATDKQKKLVIARNEKRTKYILEKMSNPESRRQAPI